MPRLRWSSESVDDLCEIALYLAKHAPESAERVIDKIDDDAQRLRQFPHLGHVVPEFQQERIRELIVFRYRVIYEYADDCCRVLRIIHSARDLPQHFHPDG